MPRSRPKIALHSKCKTMEEKSKDLYIKCTQRDYPMGFKLGVVREVESEELSMRGVLQKYGIRNHGTVLD